MLMVDNKYDVIVVGGGPAGMIAAGKAAELGAKVVLIEKNDRLGVKLLITGKGRCNITNSENELKKWIEKFGENGKFLYGAFNKFSNNDVLDFFNSRGIETKIERGGRIFPSSDKSIDVQMALMKYLEEGKVNVRCNTRVVEVVMKNGKIMGVVIGNNEIIEARKYIFSTGGKSYPMTGSSGDGYEWLRAMGHTIIEPSPALVPILLKEKWVKEVEGLSLKNVEISVYADNKKKISRFGEAIFTANGMSGPIILDMSREVGKLSGEKIELKIDFKPRLNHKELDTRIQNDFREQNNKIFRNALDKILPKKLIPVIIRLSGIAIDKKVNLITRDERKVLLHLLKNLNFNIDGLDGFNKAIVTAGGVSLSEIDPRSMESRVVKDLYVCGELLDLDGPTGGYNLQICWSTGNLAGESAGISSVD